MLNKGTAFTAEERAALGLTGLLPPFIRTLRAQVRAAYIQYERLPDALSENVYLTALHDRNEVLFYRLFSEHLREMGLAGVKLGDIVQQVQDAMWQPEYRSIHAT